MLDLDLVGILSLLVLLGLTFLCYFTYRLYGSRFFLFFSLAWFSNVIYIVCEAWLKKLDYFPESISGILIYFVSLISTYFFLFTLKYNKIKRILSDIQFYTWTSFIFVWFLIIYFVIPSNFKFKYQLSIFPGIIVSSWILIRLAYFIRKKTELKLDELLRGNEESVAVIIRKEAEIAKDMAKREGSTDILVHVQNLLNLSKNLFIFSFLLYGILQPLYLFRPVLSERVFTVIFYFAIGLKICFGLATLLVAVSDFRYCQIATKVRSIVEEVSVMSENVEHGIRGPISNILKDLILLKEKVQHDGSLSNTIQGIKDNIERIRDYASVIPAMKETQQYYEKRFQKWNLISLVRESANTARNKFPGIKIRLIYRSPETPIFILGYRERLVEAFVNIITNSIEAYSRKPSFEGERLIEFYLSPNRDSGMAILKVKDYGVGIPADILPSIADARFSTKDATSDPNRGLGLFFAKLYIRQHRGKISFESDGSSFTIVTLELPLTVKEAREEDL